MSEKINQSQAASGRIFHKKPRKPSQPSIDGGRARTCSIFRPELACKRPSRGGKGVL
jgi:hypothetical protein